MWNNFIKAQSQYRLVGLTILGSVQGRVGQMNQKTDKYLKKSNFLVFVCVKNNIADAKTCFLGYVSDPILLF